MNVSPVSVAVIDKKTITKAEVLRAGKDGKAVKIQAITNGKYLLTQNQDGTAPENITVKRVGKNLLVMLEGSDASKPDLIIEDFFAKSGTLVGKAEDGEMHAYVATDGNADHEAAALADGETTALALGEGSVDDNSGFALASGFEWSPALIALGGLAAIAAAAGLGYVAAKHHYDNNVGSHSGKGEGGGGSGGGDISKPTISDVIDDIGDVTGSVANGGRTDDTMPTFNGTGTPGNTIEIWDGETLLGEVLVDDEGNWTFTPEKPLAAGNHSIVTAERNAEGVVGEKSDPWEFIIDLTAPAKGTIGSVMDDMQDPPVLIEKGGVTKDNTPTLTGKAEAGSTVEIWNDGVKLGTAKVDAEGNWTFTAPALQDGRHELSIVVVDQVGNKSLPSDPFIVDVDTVAPENPGIGVIKDSEGNPLEDGSTTKDLRPTLEGSGNDGDIVVIIDNGKPIGSVIVEDGKWSFTPENNLQPGEHELEIVVRDPAGNESPASDKVTIGFEGDTQVPVDPEPVDGLPDPDVPVSGVIEHIFKDNNDAGVRTPIENGGAMNDPSIIVAGKGVPGELVTIYIVGLENSYSFTTTIGADGKWELTTTDLADDVYQLRGLFSSDGEVTGKTDIYEVEVDTIPPPPPEINALELAGLDLSALLSLDNHELFNEADEQQQPINAELVQLNNNAFNDWNNQESQSGVMAENNSQSDALFLQNEIEQF
ncbi:Ig-like domain-containing protein [Pantoea dispersa]|uniref:Ig-like domain-containing protein n=1 Tax=Pantoea dispersa TaxID=59814 RepID=UPI002DB61ADF|nr:Ig-like domain-containing protein [Pantoea dispersa]MEB5837551.1 Ig-like domain-containing protein [Pantoea dispersa]